ENLHQTVRGRIVEIGASEWAADSARRTASQVDGQPNGSAVASPHQNRATAATGQFDIADERSPQEVADLIRKLGYEPVWKDWDAALTV
ncbi:MAG TPA: hypothetical protein VKA67_04725, partial [Verrucomicrobiae bacterium]|nr:hypothetical protein [Verrucomicrobiae bacterium]